jgi:dihydroxy-acid dehydratase
MLLRNLLAMEVEESIRGNPIDAVVLLGGCDKTTPGQLAAQAARARIKDMVRISDVRMSGTAAVRSRSTLVATSGFTSRP